MAAPVSHHQMKLLREDPGYLRHGDGSMKVVIYDSYPMNWLQV
jgi:hypothetical protein